MNFQPNIPGLNSATGANNWSFFQAKPTVVPQTGVKKAKNSHGKEDNR
jgi:hypothetical protein